MGGGVIGRRYRWRGEVWTVICRWHGRGPRNVLIEADDGTQVVRPFRGLRRRIRWWLQFPAGTEVDAALGLATRERAATEAGQITLEIA